MKNLIVHHTDADGYCAAAVAYYKILGDAGSIVIPDKVKCSFIPYNYGMEFPEISNGDMNELENVFFLDVSMSNDLYKIIKHFVDAGKNIVHIDHHKTTMEYLNENPNDELLKKITHFYVNGISGCMLTWIYSILLMHNLPISEDSFELNRDAQKLKIKSYEVDIVIPYGITLIDDNDVWRHHYADSKLFALAYSAIDKKDLDITSEFWNSLVTSYRPYRVTDMIKEGYSVNRYKESSNKKLISGNAFEYDIPYNENGKDKVAKCLCVNSCEGNSLLFGDEIDNYDAVVKFGFNGKLKKWIYSIYSSKNDIDVSAIAKTYGGGGHKGAAGFQTKDFFFKFDN